MSVSQMMTTSSRDSSSHQIWKCAAKSSYLSFGNQGRGVPMMLPRDKGKKKEREVLQEFPI